MQASIDLQHNNYITILFNSKEYKVRVAGPSDDVYYCCEDLALLLNIDIPTTHTLTLRQVRSLHSNRSNYTKTFSSDGDEESRYLSEAGVLTLYHISPLTQQLHDLMVATIIPMIKQFNVDVLIHHIEDQKAIIDKMVANHKSCVSRFKEILHIFSLSILILDRQ